MMGYNGKNNSRFCFYDICAYSEIQLIDACGVAGRLLSQLKSICFVSSVQAFISIMILAINVS